MKSALRPQRAALLALACGAAATLLAWHLVGRQGKAQAEAEFASQTSIASNVVEGRMRRYIDVLYGLSAFAIHEQSPTREQFHLYARGLEIPSRFPGLLAVEFVRRIPEADRDRYVAQVRGDRSVQARGYPEFNIRPPGARDEYWVIDYIEPVAGNESAFGLDIRTRQAVMAAERARDSGEPEMTGRYRLVQEPGDRLGLVIYLPVYGVPEPLSELARRDALKGFVGVVLRVDDLFGGLLSDPALAGIELTVHDRGPADTTLQEPSEFTRVYSTRPDPGEAELAAWQWRPELAQDLRIAGREWHLAYRAEPRPWPWLEPLPLLVLGAGLAVSLLVFAMLQAIARSRAEALEMAQKATRELRTQLSFTQQLIEAIPNPVFFKDERGRYLGCNHAFEQYAGVERASLIGKTVFDILPADTADRSQLADNELFERPGAQAYEASVAIANTGQRREVIVNKATFYDVTGAVAGLVGVIVDITQRKQLEAATIETNERLRAVIEAAPVAIVARDLNAVIRMWNPAAERMFGYREAEVLETRTSIVPEHLRDGVRAMRRRAEAGEVIFIEDTQGVRKDGTVFDAQLTFAPVYGEDRKVIGSMATIADVTRRKAAEAALRESEARLRLAMDAAQMGMWYWEPETDRFTYSEGINTLFGRPAGSPPTGYAELRARLHADDQDIADATLRYAIKQGNDFQVDYRVVWPDNSVHWLANRGQVHRSEDGRAQRIVGVVMDISERKLAEQRIVHMAHHDALTGLPNRALLRDRIQQAIAQAHRSGSQLAVLFIDLDRFKTINDSLGHQLGDRLLQSVGSRILVCVREGDTVARVGGDEFVIVIPSLESSSDASTVAGKILEVLGHPFHLHGNDLHVAASIGIALYPADGTDAETLMRNADTAMYHAKDSGRGNFQFFTAHMNVAAQQRLQLENSLRRAIDAGEFEVVYQPLFDLRDRSITGFEALLRWNPPGGDPVPPSQFISAAEESGLIVPIGDYVLREALRAARTWQDAGRAIFIAVNVSAVQLARLSFVERLRSLIDETGLDPALVELEVTESVIVAGAGEARDAIDQIAALGVGIAIDDFGTGYSGLAYLKRLPIDTVKIDQSFVRDLTVDPDDAAIVTAIVAMARSLGVDVVAEGVETAEQLAELERLGCHRAQGYLLARPMSAAAVTKLLARGALTPA